MAERARVAPWSAANTKSIGNGASDDIAVDVSSVRAPKLQLLDVRDSSGGGDSVTLNSITIDGTTYDVGDHVATTSEIRCIDVFGTAISPGDTVTANVTNNTGGTDTLEVSLFGYTT